MPLTRLNFVRLRLVAKVSPFAIISNDRIRYLIGLNKERMRVQLEADTPIGGWRDLIRGTTGTGAELMVEPLDVRILKLVTGEDP